MSFEVNEGSSFCLNVLLKDSDGEPLSPIDSVKWWVGKPKSDVPVLEEQTVTGPTAEMELIIPASAHICSGRKDEGRFVVVQVQSGADHLKHDWFEYTVLAQYTVPYPPEPEEEP
jgi:hypothetical protein